MSDVQTVAIITGAIVAGVAASFVTLFGVVLMWRARRPAVETVRRRRVPLLFVLCSYVVICAITEANPSAEVFDAAMEARMSSASTPVRNRHPLPCIRKHEGAYADGGPGAYGFIRSTWNSVSNARQEALWSRLGERRYWSLQDEKAWRLYELRGLQPWPTSRRDCR